MAAAAFGDELAIMVFNEKEKNNTIVIDSGHGGVDPGKVGTAGVLEKDINLSIAKKVKKLLEQKKYRVVMTRSEDKGLYQDTDSNKKMADMRARVSLIHETNPAMAVSIHQNSFGSPQVKGAQVFYYQGSEEGKWMADLVQDTLKEKLADGNHRIAKANNNYYMLCQTDVPFLIIECGFLSNPQEEQLLGSEEYQGKMAAAIATGIEKCLIQKKGKT